MHAYIYVARGVIRYVENRSEQSAYNKQSHDIQNVSRIRKIKQYANNIINKWKHEATNTKQVLEMNFEKLLRLSRIDSCCQI